ncbi:ABC transporter substrate-binding protein [Ruminococcus gauvreauii]|uniref:ABC transporter substrate-binding protein n=1 Tax=Ruminococcus gauvreauii TaxID=438033 RepID=A0ABY5VG90_9FIRM|nr:ABC transporter substrate-binding protein [Ruminococcus gauvreauii]UWP58503.1 ABC transporter substrate-binding protein [Ruminococcus gauvreauii]
MKKAGYFVLAALCMAVLITGCGKQEKKEDAVQEQTGKEDPYTSDFSIEYLDDGVKLVTDAEGRKMYLVPREAEIPGEAADEMVVRTPVERVVYMSTTQVCMLQALDSEEIWKSITGVAGARETWTIDEVVQRFDDGQIRDVGGDMGEPDYELIQSMDPELVFVYTGSNPQTGVIEKFEELGIPYAVDNEYMETTYMGRLDWLRFIAAFYNEDTTGEAVIQEAAASIERMKEKIAGEDRPTVSYGSLFDGVVYVASGEGWIADMIEDAGGDYIFKDIEAADTQISLEEFYARSEDADILIYSTTPDFTPDMASVLAEAPVLEDLKAVQDGAVWQLDNSFWMSADQPDQVAQDLSAMFHPDVFPDRELRYFIPFS